MKKMMIAMMMVNQGREDRDGKRGLWSLVAGG